MNTHIPSLQLSCWYSADMKSIHGKYETWKQVKAVSQVPKTISDTLGHRNSKVIIVLWQGMTSYWDAIWGRDSRGSRNYVLDRSTLWLYLVNTIEQCMVGIDAGCHYHYNSCNVLLLSYYDRLHKQREFKKMFWALT